MQFDEHDIVLDAGALRDAVRGALGEPSRGTFLLARRSPQARAKREFGRHTRTSPQARAKREFGRRTRLGPVPVGLAYLAYTWTLEHGGQSAWLDELYVVPGERSRGVGTALLRAALDHAARRGCRAVDLEVEAAHARAARLYAREGFRPHHRARWYRRLDLTPSRGSPA